VSGYETRFALVRGVVYREQRSIRDHDIETYWMRVSIPPDGAPGKRSKWRVKYAADRLPAHEIIPAERATQIVEFAHAAFFGGAS
jgi:hypothetical protein